MKITIRMVYTEAPARPNVENPMSHRVVYYKSGKMRRKDNASGSESPSLSSIANCETKSGLLIDMNAREYRSYKVPKFQTEADLREYLQKNPDNPYHIALVPVESRTADTGERKKFFGFEAKHLITTNRAASGNSSDGEEIIDGWYIDHDEADNNCAPDSARAELSHVIPTLLRGPMEIPEFHHTGPLPTGLVVKETHTVHFTAKGGAAARVITAEDSVEELSDSPLMPSVFELPAGMKENPQLWKASPVQPKR